MRKHYYHGTSRSYIVAFASLFDGVFCETGGGEKTPVPLHYAPKQKFMEILDADYDKNSTDIESTLPRMAFEMVGLNYAPERHLNPMHELSDPESGLRSFNRVPYDFSFNLYAVTKEFDDSLEIMEQIVPMFTPDFCVSINEKVGPITITTNLVIVLNSSSFNIDYEGGFGSSRRIEWSFGFTLKGYLYQNVDTVKRIKKSIVNMNTADSEIPFMVSTAEVVPSTAEKSDPHTIVERITE